MIKAMDDGNATVAGSVTVLVPKRYYSFCYKSLFLPRFQGKPPAPPSGEKLKFYGLATVFNLLPLFTDVDLSLLDSTSDFGRCFAAAFFMPEKKRGAVSAP